MQETYESLIYSDFSVAPQGTFASLVTILLMVHLKALPPKLSHGDGPGIHVIHTSQRKRRWHLSRALTIQGVSF